MPGERVERHRGEQLKVVTCPTSGSDDSRRRAAAAAARVSAAKASSEEVGRRSRGVPGSGADAGTCRTQHGDPPGSRPRRQRRRSSLSFGPSDVNSGEIHMGIAQRRQQPPHPCETSFGPRGITERIADEAAFIARALPELRERSLVVPASVRTRRHSPTQCRSPASRGTNLPSGSQSGILRLKSPRPQPGPTRFASGDRSAVRSA